MLPFDYFCASFGLDNRPAKGHGSLTEQATDWAGVMGVDRPPTHIIEKRGTQLEGAIKCTRLIEKRWGTEAIPLQAGYRTVKQTIYGG
jgi:hypothetical protein